MVLVFRGRQESQRLPLKAELLQERRSEMATELKPGTPAGLDEARAQKLRQAGIDTVEKLAEIDADAVANQTGLSADDLRQLKTEAAVRAPSVPRRRSITTTHVMLVLIAIAVIAVFYGRWAAGRNATRLMEAQHKLTAAVARSATVALEHINAAAANVAGGNWGVAQTELNKAGEEITFLETIAPSDVSGNVRDARSSLSGAQDAVGSRDAAAAQRIDDLKAAVSKLSGAKAG